MRHDRRLLRFLARNGLIGIAAGWLVLAALVGLNVARLRDLLAAAEQGWLVLLLVAAGFAVTFGSLAMGTAVFLLPHRD